MLLPAFLIAGWAESAAPPSAAWVASRVGELVGELQKSYEEKLRQLQLQHDELRDKVAALALCSCDGAEKTKKKTTPKKTEAVSRLLSSAPDVSSGYSGISVKRDDSYIALGEDSDTLLVRTGAAHLAVVADRIAFHGTVCVDGEDGCLTVSDGELLFNGDSVSTGSGLDDFVNKSLIGRQCASVDVSPVTDGCVHQHHPTTPSARVHRALSYLLE